jgi:hypothetical protein
LANLHPKRHVVLNLGKDIVTEGLKSCIDSLLLDLKLFDLLSALIDVLVVEIKVSLFPPWICGILLLLNKAKLSPFRFLLDLPSDLVDVGLH